MLWRSIFSSAKSCRYVCSLNPSLCIPCTIQRHSHVDAPMNVFNRKAKRIQKNRTAILPDYHVYDYVKEEIGWRVVDRVFDIKRKLDVVVDLGCSRGHVSKHLFNDCAGTVIQCDMAEKVLIQSRSPEDVPTNRIIVDEEFLPFKANTVDAVVSSLSLHWVNDLPGTFAQILQILKKDGVFLGSMFGGDTLYELRSSLTVAETENEGGFGPHISPFTDNRDLGGLLHRAGFNLLTVDVDELVVNYPGMFELMTDLQRMGENNCSWTRKATISRSTQKLAAETYKKMYANEDGSVPATFQVLYFIGWKPDRSQQQPAPRGSGEVSMKDLYQIDRIVKEKGTIDSPPDEKK